MVQMRDDFPQKGQSMTDELPTWVAGPTFRAAMTMAIELHASHARKSEREPYLGHLLGVASNVIEAGGSEVQTAAALLHDAIEDQGADEATIERETSHAVARIVLNCTEPKLEELGPNRADSWMTRKQRYLDHLRAATSEDESVLVALADKVNNCEKSARDFHRHVNHDGLPIENFWKEFNAGDSCQRWWYTSLLECFEGKPQLANRLAQPLLNRFAHAVEELFSGREILVCDRNHQHAPAHSNGES